ncbi:MAG: 6-phosphogluconolactonase [Deltaproteobacteria bacterium]|nr:6-phosphogluconolactonase [Deltaproteobacteria bacterium]
MQIRVLSDIEAISHEASKIFVNLAKKYIASSGRFVNAISGGSTPKRFYELLASDNCSGNVDWSRVHFFWADERCVPKESEESNFKLAFVHLLSKIEIPAENIHRINGEDVSEKGAKDYEDEIRRFFGALDVPVFDLIILGVGEDGHTASLFPDSTKSLDEKTRLAVPVYTEKMNRITLTLPVLNNARHILFLVSGQSKARVINDILADKGKRGNYPAGLINPVHGDLLWLIDEAAAGE